MEFTVSDWADHHRPLIDVQRDKADNDVPWFKRMFSWMCSVVLGDQDVHINSDRMIAGSASVSEVEVVESGERRRYQPPEYTPAPLDEDQLVPMSTSVNRQCDMMMRDSVIRQYLIDTPFQLSDKASLPNNMCNGIENGKRKFSRHGVDHIDHNSDRRTSISGSSDVGRRQPLHRSTSLGSMGTIYMSSVDQSNTLRRNTSLGNLRRSEGGCVAGEGA